MLQYALESGHVHVLHCWRSLDPDEVLPGSQLPDPHSLKADDSKPRKEDLLSVMVINLQAVSVILREGADGGMGGGGVLGF